MFLIEQDASGILIYCKINLHIVSKLAINKIRLFMSEIKTNKQ